MSARKRGSETIILTPEKIQQVIRDAHKRRPGVILSTREIYDAIAQAQHQDDVDWLEKYRSRDTRTHIILVIPKKNWQAFKEGK